MDNRIKILLGTVIGLLLLIVLSCGDDNSTKPNQVADPYFSLSSGTYTTFLQVEINCLTVDSEIFYTLDGSQPTELSLVYNEPLIITSTSIVKAIAFKDHYQASKVTIAEYELVLPMVETPSFTPSTGTYNFPQSVVINCETTNVQIRYTLDETEPTDSSELFSGEISIDSSTIIKAKAFKTNYHASEIVQANYLIEPLTVSTPTFSPLPGVISGDEAITISCSTLQAEIHYTIDGDEPTELSPIYTDPLNLSSNVVLKARAFKNNYLASEIAIGNFIITNETTAVPTFNPSPGTYSVDQTITLNCSTDGAKIYYTLNGSLPTSESLIYNNPIDINSTTIIQAFAQKDDLLPSIITSGGFIISYQTVQTPEINPPPDAYADNVLITMTCSTHGAAIFYTLDGSEPTELSLLYTEPFEISSSATLKTRAFKIDYLPSEITEGYYNIVEYTPSNFILVEGGTFNNETSDITLSDFYICEHEVTQTEYEAVVGNNPSNYIGYARPVENIRWIDAVKYANMRSIQEGLSPCYTYNNEGFDPNEWSEGWTDPSNHTNFSCNFDCNGYRLPTEMEWMYAAKGGNQQPASDYNQFSGTNSYDDLPNYAWYHNTSVDDKPEPVGTKLPNQLGIYDMTGNVFEWCWDIYGDFSEEAQTNPVGPSMGDHRVYHGGNSSTYAFTCRISYRGNMSPAYGGYFPGLGVRLIRSFE